MPKHHSTTYTLADAAGVHPRTARRYLREIFPRRELGWYRLEPAQEAAALSGLQSGRQVCENQPRRHAPKAVQLSLFD